MDYYNETDLDGRVYISAIADTLGMDMQPTDTLIESALPKLPLAEKAEVAKPLQLSVPLFVFPNPFQEELNLQFHALETETWEIRLLDNLGSVVRQQPQEVTKGFNNTRFSTLSVPPGMYFLQCVSAKGYVLQSAKVVKVK
ncbi:MAG: T9SS type A sorting domain-containing protein [Haliscomenobacter sp.]|nr:T9SS type A sorting domain-containing protein [Haliscomenobacter sp.]